MTDTKPSKSARKREHLELQKLGEALISLRDSELEAMHLDDDLLEAIRSARNMRSHGALRRQKQLIGKLMRGADANAIRATLAARDTAGLAGKRRFARAEHWRDRLVRGDPDAFGEFVAETGADDQQLRRLIAALAAAPAEREEKSLKRKIFRRIHALLEGTDQAARRRTLRDSG